jgi:putative sigma-54 modulation protein
MEITFTGRKCTLRESFKERVQTKLAKIERILGEDAEAKVTVTVEKSEQIVELTVMKGGMIFRSEESAHNMNDAFDSCVDSLIRQIRKNKTRLEKRIHSGSFDEFISAEPVAEELEFNIVRTKTISTKPQDIEEAILQMNLLGHQFYMFLNADTEKMNVVYIRKDGSYGVLVSESK